ncbi:hypothetical protein TSOC_009763 [Tetrabaena socialis]|uniref:Uncharacterized protein n=1 Tax=Tetrabaena socialis TaxID=47790 RepID=A0A2J7ZV18_9CHLO|nr:hypothetical protein TSOC_009763 [Tetrabaena socialis]|eukprot:PNH04112.1 hypothetical protein TSOC_009763 [Tetrabaena socialis]
MTPLTNQINYMTQPCMGFYAKVACPYVLGYTFIEQDDVQGFDINLVNGVAPPVGNKTVNDLAIQCNSTPGCQSFNWVNWDVPRSYLKTATGPITAFPSQQRPCMGIYVKGCQQVAGYTSTAAVDHAGDDIDRAWSIAAAANNCTADSSCKGFNSGGYYKRVASPLQANADEGLCFYTKKHWVANGTRHLLPFFARLQLYGCNPSPAAQQFTITPVDDAFAIKSIAGKAFDVSDSSTNAGARIQLWDFGGSSQTNQLWYIQ